MCNFVADRKGRLVPEPQRRRIMAMDKRDASYTRLAAWS
jgi:hypothetical protein